VVAVLVVEPRPTAGLQLSLPCAVDQHFALVPEGAKSLGVGLEVLEVPRHARLGQELAHGDDVAVRQRRFAVSRRVDSLDGLHCSLLASTG